MKKQRYFITGIAGTGKSTICTELAKRGYGTIEVDEEHGLTRWVNKETGEIGEWFSGIGIDWINNHDWVWDSGKLEELLNKDENKPVFVCGITSNQEKDLHLFDKIFLLRANQDTVRKRLMGRKTKDAFGQTEDEIEHIFDWSEDFENNMISKGVIAVNADGSTGEIIEDILSRI
jgi:dephospho-CoA kinase